MKGGMVMEGFPELETSRLKLLEVKEVYAWEYYAVLSNEKVTRFYGMDTLTDYNQAVNMIKLMQETFQKQRGIRWAIVLKDSDKLIGTVGLNLLNRGQSRAEIGYELHPDFWRKGIASETVEKVLQYTFETLQLNRIGAITFPQNKASIELLNRFRFQQEGILRQYLYQNGESHDAIIFSLLKNEWMTR